jgi:hypothetical protein
MHMYPWVRRETPSAPSTESNAARSPVHAPDSPGLRRPDVFTLHLGVMLGPEWANWMDGVEILNRNDGSGMLTALVPDQARLFGLLLKVRDLGIPLLGLYPASSLPLRAE